MSLNHPNVIMLASCPVASLIIRNTDRFLVATTMKSRIHCSFFQAIDLAMLEACHLELAYQRKAV